MELDSETQPSANFTAGDIVWVRITRIGWWPATVVKGDDLPESFGEVRPNTIAVVKFFNEDEYEEITDSRKIQTYSCDDKEDYIKQGMVKFLEFKKKQAKNSPFDNFPPSVIQAEKVTGGDPVLGEPDRYDVKKTPVANKYKDIFIDPDQKSKSTPKSAVKGSRGKSSPQKTPVRITHPRFHGASDHEVRIRQQPSPLASDDRLGSPTTSSTSPGQYKCEECSYVSNRLNVFILHRKTHKDGVQPSTPVKPKKKHDSSVKRNSSSSGTTKKRKRDVEDDSQGDPFDSIKKSAPSQSPAKKKQQSPVKKSPKKTVEQETPTKSPKKKWLSQAQIIDPEVKNKILADWDEEEDMEVVEEKKTNIADDSEGEAKTETISNVVEQHTDDEESDREQANGKAEEQAEEVVECREEEAVEKEQNDEKLKEELEALLAATAPPVIPSNIEQTVATKDATEERNTPENEDAVEEKISTAKSNTEVQTEEDEATDGVQEAEQPAEEVTSTTTSEQFPPTEEQTYVLVGYSDGETGLQELAGLDTALLGYTPNGDEAAGNTVQNILIDPSTLQTEGELGNIFFAVDEGHGLVETNDDQKTS